MKTTTDELSQLRNKTMKTKQSNQLNLGRKLKSIMLPRETVIRKAIVKLQPFSPPNSVWKLVTFGNFMVMTTLAAGIAYAAVTSFGGRVPRLGSSTLPRSYNTTTQFRNISVRMSENAYDLDIKAVTCGGSDIGGYRRIPAGDRGVHTLAANVRNGTCFRLNVTAPTFNYFDISGTMTY
jgi:hypothetical protein